MRAADVSLTGAASISQARGTNSELSPTLVPPSQQAAKQNSVLLQSTLRGLKDNYVNIEQQIAQETHKQRQGQ